MPSDSTHCVAIFDRHDQAEAAVRELGRGGFDMKKLSIIGREYHTEEHAIGFYNADDRVRYWGKTGAFWGSIFGILLAPAFFWIPGIGPILTGGLIGSAIMGTLEGAAVGAALVGGASAVSAALVGIGIPKDSVVKYETALRANGFVLIASGTASEVETARSLLAGLGTTADVHAR